MRRLHDEYDPCGWECGVNRPHQNLTDLGVLPIDGLRA